MGTSFAAGGLGQRIRAVTPGNFLSGSYGTQSQTLNTSFVRGSAGVAYGSMFISPVSGDLEEVWVAVEQTNGTWTDTDEVIQYEIYPGLAASNRPDVSSAPLFSGNITVGASDSDKWVGATGLSHTLVKDEDYFISISDSDGGDFSGDNVTMRGDTRGTGMGNFMPFDMDTTNGWSAGANEAYPTACILKIDGKYYAGSIQTGITPAASNSLYKGCRFYLPEPMTWVGITCIDKAVSMGVGAIVALFADAVAPNGVPVGTMEWSLSGGSVTGMPSHPFHSPGDEVDVAAGWYRIVAKRTGADTDPQRVVSFSNLPSGAWALCGMDGINAPEFTTDDGTGTGWTDTADEAARIVAQFVPQTISAGGGTTGRQGLHTIGQGAI